MLTPISAKIPMAERSPMPGMLESKSTASDQPKAACGEDGASCEAESDAVSSSVSCFLWEELPLLEGTVE